MSDIVSKNLLVYPYSFNTKTTNGLTANVNNDGSISINGAPTQSMVFFDLFIWNNINAFTLAKGAYIISMNGNNDFRLTLYLRTASDGTVEKAVQKGIVFEVSETEANRIKSNELRIAVRVDLRNLTIGENLNVVLYPMIRLASDTDDTWEPYHPPIHVPDVYFRCTSTAGGAKLEVSYGDEFVGKVLTATNGNKTIRRMAGTSGTVTFTVPESGLWTVSGEVDGTTYSVQESVVLDYSVALVSGFDYKSWLTAGGVDPTSYSSLADVLADEILVRRLMTIHAAVDYLASFQSVNAGLETVINNDICAKWINLRDYALDTLHANSAIAAVMDEADKYFYGEWCLMPQVPTMTSNTAPSGEVVTYNAESYSPSHSGYYAFDGNESNYADIKNAVGSYIGYKFSSPVCVKKLRIKLPNNYYASDVFILKGSNDNGLTFTTIKDNITGLTNTWADIDITNDASYSEYVICLGTKTSSNSGLAFTEIQFYAYAPKGCVPVMTSNTAPYGEASASSSYTAFSPYNAFDESVRGWYTAQGSSTGWLQYKFATPTKVKKIQIGNAVYYVATVIQVQGSNDGSTFETIDTINVTDTTKSAIRQYSIDNDAYYLYYRLNITASVNVDGGGNTTVGLNRVQFYGRQLSVSVPVMTSNTAPYGEASASEEIANYPAWEAFDGTLSDYQDAWYVTGKKTGWIQYKFVNPIIVKHFTLTNRGGQYHAYAPKAFTLKASNDGSTWATLGSYTNSVYTVGAITDYDVDNSNPYLYYRLDISDADVGSTGYTNLSVGKLQFYGLDYSEKEFEAGTTKKWLYDHGVELETISDSKGTNGGNMPVHGDHSITLQSGSSSSSSFSKINVAIDLTPYKLMRAKSSNAKTGSNSCAVDVESTSGSELANKWVVLNDLPNNLYLDVTNINQSCKPYLLAASGQSAVFEIDEWWLE